MNYTGRYGLEINPFIKNGKDVLVETNEYKEVKFRLNYLLHNCLSKFKLRKMECIKDAVYP